MSDSLPQPTHRAPGLFSALVILGAALFVGWPYRPGGFVTDDQFHLQAIAAVERGELTWYRFLCEPYSVHFLPLWRLWYYAQWRLSGMSPENWHGVISLVHGLGAVALFGLLRGFLRSAWCAFAGAALWSACAMGRPDNPLNYLGASHFIFATAGWLAALWCAAKWRTTGGHRWLVASGAAALASVASMGAFTLLLPAIPAVAWFAGPVDGRSANWRAAWIAWGAVALIAGLSQVVFVAPYLSRLNQDGLPLDLGRAFVSTIVQYPIAMGNLAGWRVNDSLWGGMAIKSIAAVLLVGVTLLVSSKSARGLLWIILAATLAFTALANLRGSIASLEVLLVSCRYAYLVVLPLCVCVAASLDATLFASTDHALPAKLVLFAGLVGFCGIQFGVARQTHASWERVALQADYRAREAECRRVLQLLDAMAQDEPLRLPDVEVRFPFVPYKLSSLSVLMLPRGSHTLQVLKADALTPDERDAALRRLESIREQEPLAAELIAAIRAQSNPSPQAVAP